MSVKKKNEYRKSATKILKNAYRNSNRKRDLVITVTSGMLIAFLIILVGFFQGKIKTDQLRYHRENGSIVYAYVENGSSKTVDNLEQVSKISYIGLEKSCGFLISNGLIYSECSFMEEKDWKKLKAGAYTNIHGSYPKEANEIMMSTQTLESLGIHRPRIGMKLSLEFYWNNVLVQQETGEQEFILAGYFTDYTSDSYGNSISYLSNEKLSKAKISKFPCRILLDIDSGLQNGESLYRMLTQSISLGKNEYFVVKDSAYYKSIRGIAGSFVVVTILCCMIFLSVFMLIYQMIKISLLKEMRLFERMRTLGVTTKQMQKVVCWQCVQELLVGIIFGEVLACLSTQYILPRVLKKMYLGEMGNLEEQSFVSGFFCAGSALLFILFGMLAAYWSIRIMFRRKWIQDDKTMSYMILKEQKMKKKSVFKSLRIKKQEKLWKKTKSFLMEMSWYFIKNSGRSFIFSTLLVALGGTTALCMAGLTSGTDLLNNLEKQPEFRIGITYNSYDFLRRRESDLWEFDFFSENLLDQLEELAQQMKGRTEIKKGYLLNWFDSILTEENELENYAKAYVEIEKQDYMISDLYRYAADIPQGIICAFTKEEEERILKRISSQRKILNEGEAILVHQGIPFNDNLEESWEEIDFYVGDLSAGGTSLNDVLDHISKVTVVECTDLLKNDLSDFDWYWEEENVCWLIVSEETFQTLSKILYQRVLEVSFYVSDEMEQKTKERLQEIVDKANEKFRIQYDVKADLVSLTCKSELIAQQTRYLQNSRFCMLAICLLLFLLGILTYASTRYLELVMYEKEMKILKILGVTWDFQRKALRVEGLIYCAAIVFLIFVMTNCVIEYLDRLVKLQSKYYSAEFPGGAFVVIAVIVFMGGLLVPIKKEN